MKTEVVYFDTRKNSMYGTFRGLVAFGILVIVFIIWFLLTYKSIYKPVFVKVMHTQNPKFRIWPFAIIFVLLCSALAVQIPGNWQEALVYGLLVGLVVFGIANLTLISMFNDYSLWVAAVDIVFAMALCGGTSVCVYYISKATGWYEK